MKQKQNHFVFTFFIISLFSSVTPLNLSKKHGSMIITHNIKAQKPNIYTIKVSRTTDKEYIVNINVNLM
jgi:hypothetical protein